MNSLPNVPGVEALLIPRGAKLDIRIEPAAGSEELRARIDARWQELLAANPRFHDGDLLAVTSWNGTSIACRRGTFRELAARPQVNTGCELLAVSAIVVARARDGVERILLGKRHRQTRVYGGLWELGPSGGMSVPAPSVTKLDETDLLQQVEAELHEEAGLSLANADVSAVGIVRDLEAFSLDIAFRVAMRAPLEELRPGERDWEYEEVRWMTAREALDAVTARPEQFIPPARLMLANPGWLGAQEVSRTAY